YASDDEALAAPYLPGVSATGPECERGELLGSAPLVRARGVTVWADAAASPPGRRPRARPRGRGLGRDMRAGGPQPRRAILADVDLDLRAGSITAVVGANGAGKSTLLRALAG